MGSDDLYKKAKAGKEKREQGIRGKVKDTILIICEGVKTEPNYFESFRLSNVKINGCGKDPSQLVQIAKENFDTYDQLWCVFDRDNVPAEKFNIPFQLSEKLKKKIKIAYSNEAFELWYLLHFHYYNTGMSRDDYQERLSNLLGYKYQKNSKTMYHELLDNQQTAIDNAKKLLASYPDSNPEQDNPSTTVHLLVEELNKYKRK